MFNWEFFVTAAIFYLLMKPIGCLIENVFYGFRLGAKHRFEQKNGYGKSVEVHNHIERAEVEAAEKTMSRSGRLESEFRVVNDNQPITTNVSNRYSDNDRSHRPGSRGL